MAMKGFFSGALAFGVLLAAAAVACTALSLRLRQRAEESDARASDRALYELGKRDAESAKADVEGPLGRMLRDAGIEASPVSWTLCLGTVGAFAAFFGMRASGLLGAMLGVGLVCIAAALYVLRARAKRRELLSRQFVRLVPQLSASVKSSLTLERALRVSADHAPEPLRSELMAVLARVSYGMPLVQALARMAQSTGDADVAALASAMRIQQRFGGSMGAVLDLIAEHAQGSCSRSCAANLRERAWPRWWWRAPCPRSSRSCSPQPRLFPCSIGKTRWGGPCLRALRSWRWRVLRRAVGSQGSRIRRACAG